MLPFSPPRIDQRIIDEVTDTLRSGWISTGPKTKLFEKKITEYVGCKTTVAVSAWTTGMEIVLRWWGIGPGDEVIIPVYTYCASANVVLHTGAKAIMVDVSNDDFNIALDKIEADFGADIKSQLLENSKKFRSSKTLILEDNHLKITRTGKFLSDGIASDLFLV